MNPLKKTLIIALLIWYSFYPYNKILAQNNDHIEIFKKITEIEEKFYILFSDLIEAENLGADISSNIDNLNSVLNNIKIIKSLLDDEKIDEAQSYIIFTEEVIETINQEVKTQVDSSIIKRQQTIQINTITSIIIIGIGILAWRRFSKIYQNAILELKPEVETTEN